MYRVVLCTVFPASDWFQVISDSHSNLLSPIKPLLPSCTVLSSSVNPAYRPVMIIVHCPKCTYSSLTSDLTHFQYLYIYILRNYGVCTVMFDVGLKH